MSDEEIIRKALKQTWSDEAPADYEPYPLEALARLEARLERAEKFIRWIEGMNPTSGVVTFKMRQEMQQRARQALSGPGPDTP